MKVNKQTLVPDIYTPYVVRNLIECGVIFSIFVSVQWIPLSLFVIVFNLKSLLSFVFESVSQKIMPKWKYLGFSCLSFLGIVLIMTPKLEKSQNRLNDQSNWIYLLGVFYALIAAVLAAVSDIYTHSQGSLIRTCFKQRSQYTFLWAAAWAFVFCSSRSESFVGFSLGVFIDLESNTSSFNVCFWVRYSM